MTDRRRVLLGLGATLLPGVAAALDRAPLPRARPASVPARPEGLAIRDSYAPSGRTGWMVADLDTGAVLEAHEPETGFAPASVAKLPTAFFAIERLGAAHRFETRVLATGPVEKGVVQGDLVLAGSGDPELDTDALAALVERLAARGVTGATGRLLVTGGGLPEIPRIDPEQPVDVAYNPGVAGLNLNFNRVRLKWGPDGMRVSAHAAGHDPAVQHIRVEPVADGTLFAHATDEAGERWSLGAHMMRGRGARWLPVRRPLRYGGEVFRLLAAEAGIALPEAEPVAGVPAAPVLASVSGQPLAGLVRDMLRYSTNLTAEAIGMAASGATAPAPDTLAESAARMNAWMAARCGAKAGDPRIAFVNHSGLTTESRVAPAHLVAMLRAGAARPAGPLGHPRIPGALAGMLSGHRIAAQGDGLDHANLAVLAKTGTMDYVRGLSGYVATPGGRRLAFAILTNDLPRRSGGVRSIDKRWMARARSFERALLRSWAGRFDA